MAIQTDRKIKRNRSDLVVKDYKRKTCLPIDMSVPRDIYQSKNMMKKYKDLEIRLGYSNW